MALEGLSGMGDVFSNIGISIIVSLILIFVAIIAGILFIARGGLDRWKKKVPLFARANDKIDVWEGEMIGIDQDLHIKDFFPHTYDAVTWYVNGVRKAYIPALQNIPFVVPAKSTTQKVMSFVRLGDDFIRIDGVELIAKEIVKVPVKKLDANGKEIETDELQEKRIPTAYIVNVYIPELRSIMADAELELITHAEVIRPRQNPLNQLVGYAVLGMLIFALLATLWFSYSQADKALSIAPSVVEQGMKGATNAVLEIMQNQTKGGKVL